MEKIDDACKFTSQLLDHGNTVEILSLKRVVGAQLLHLINNTPKPEVNTSIEFETDIKKFEAAVKVRIPTASGNFNICTFYKMCLLAYICPLFRVTLYPACGPGSSVGTATELQAGRSRIKSQWGREFPPVQTGPGAHPASCTIGTGSFLGVNCSWGVLLTTHPLLVPQSWNSRAVPLPTLWATPGL